MSRFRWNGYKHGVSDMAALSMLYHVAVSKNIANMLWDAAIKVAIDDIDISYPLGMDVIDELEDDIEFINNWEDYSCDVK